MIWALGMGINEMKILCLGDSNTYGYDPRSYFGSRYPSEVRWTERLGEHEVINCGMNGLPIPYDSGAFTDLIRAKAPDLLIVMLGSNDLLEGANAENTEERMDGFLNALRTTGVQILLISPPPMQHGEWVQSAELIKESEKLGKLYRNLAERQGIFFADAAGWGVELLFDGVHFSPAGHAAFAESLKETLQAVGDGDK